MLYQTLSDPSQTRRGVGRLGAGKYQKQTKAKQSNRAISKCVCGTGGGGSAVGVGQRLASVTG